MKARICNGRERRAKQCYSRDNFSAAIPASATLLLSTTLLWLNEDVIVNLF